MSEEVTMDCDGSFSQKNKKLKPLSESLYYIAMLSESVYKADAYSTASLVDVLHILIWKASKL